MQDSKIFKADLISVCWHGSIQPSLIAPALFWTSRRTKDYWHFSLDVFHRWCFHFFQNTIQKHDDIDQSEDLLHTVVVRKIPHVTWTVVYHGELRPILRMNDFFFLGVGLPEKLASGYLNISWFTFSRSYMRLNPPLPGHPFQVQCRHLG